MKKLLAALILSAITTFAFAQVDVNKADQAALDGIVGIGPAMSKRILDERAKNGNFKDWPDLEQRVKGIGEKSAVKLSDAGLTVNGNSLKKAPNGKTKGENTAEKKSKKTKDADSAKK